ncbi:MAG: ATP-binding cassette domain-containing protein [Acidimicrobiia bacterium]|nr:ATP-binding cassette domain-containing protein [Acidimicrobiia bacterium]
MSPLVTLSGVVRDYRRSAETVRALDDVTLGLDAGTVTGIVGPSGSGKTTLINLVVGWDEPTEGSVEWSVGDDWQGLAVVPQGLGLLPELTLADNVELPARLGNPQPVPTETLLEMVGLGALARRLPDEVSMGERQRASIARALAPGPAVLVADEPTSHQDEDNVRRVATLLADCAEAGAAVLVATHDERVLDRLDLVLRLEDGRLV